MVENQTQFGPEPVAEELRCYLHAPAARCPIVRTKPPGTRKNGAFAMEKRFLTLEMSSLQVEKRSFTVETSSLQVEKRSLHMETSSLQVEKRFLTLGNAISTGGKTISHPGNVISTDGKTISHPGSAISTGGKEHPPCQNRLRKRAAPISPTGNVASHGVQTVFGAGSTIFSRD